MNGTLQYVVLEGTEVLVRTKLTKYQSVPVSEELIRVTMHGHAFGTLHICPDNHGVCVSEVQPKGFDCTIIRWVWLKCPWSRIFLVL